MLILLRYDNLIKMDCLALSWAFDSRWVFRIDLHPYYLSLLAGINLISIVGL